MPLTDIENLMFRGRNVVHGVIEFSLDENSLTLTVAPWPELTSPLTAMFDQARVLAKEVDEDPNPNLPLEILGFDSYSLGEAKWQFVLHCAEVEWVIESSWPKLTSE